VDEANPWLEVTSTILAKLAHTTVITSPTATEGE
jgi:hypothetical protein